MSLVSLLKKDKNKPIHILNLVEIYTTDPFFVIGGIQLMKTLILFT